MTQKFTYDAIAKVTKELEIKSPDFFEAKDGAKLAYYAFLPEQEIKAVIVFYHGAGSWSMPIYQLMAKETSKRYKMAVYLFDIRGHGNSEGARGDTPSVETVWDDVNLSLSCVKAKHPQTFIFLGGHSAGGALILNYLSHKQGQETKADAYVFLAPYLGSDSGTKHNRKKEEEKFITHVKYLPFLIYGFSAGQFCAHKPAVFFDYGPLKKTDPLLLSFYTCTMAKALLPKNAKKILQHVEKPCALFIGQDDEQFNPLKVLQLQKYFENRASIARVISKTNHLSIVLKAPALFEEAWQNFLNHTDLS